MRLVIVTGCAGFIGFHLCKNLLEEGINVIGIDNVNDYYDKRLKEKRLDILSQGSVEKSTWKFIKADLIEKDLLLEIFQRYKPETVINLAAQAGVRYSLKNPSAYISSNIVGFSNILECCKVTKVKHLLYASSSSVYGGNSRTPFSENDPVNHPVSLYAATKRSNELMAHTYSHIYGISATGMRFFTVYGPWGRPDMAPMLFTEAIIQKKPIKIFNNGIMSRSFTYIDDVIKVIIKLMNKPAKIDSEFDRHKPIASSSWCPHRIFNVGNNNSIKLTEFIFILEKILGIKAIKEFEDMPKGDVVNTLSDNNLSTEWIGEIPYTSLDQGLREFTDWYKSYYKKFDLK